MKILDFLTKYLIKISYPLLTPIKSLQCAVYDYYISKISFVNVACVIKLVQHFYAVCHFQISNRGTCFHFSSLLIQLRIKNYRDMNETGFQMKFSLICIWQKLPISKQTLTYKRQYTKCCKLTQSFGTNLIRYYMCKNAHTKKFQISNNESILNLQHKDMKKNKANLRPEVNMYLQ